MTTIHINKNEHKHHQHQSHYHGSRSPVYPVRPNRSRRLEQNLNLDHEEDEDAIHVANSYDCSSSGHPRHHHHQESYRNYRPDDDWDDQDVEMIRNYNNNNNRKQNHNQNLRIANMSNGLNGGSGVGTSNNNIPRNNRLNDDDIIESASGSSVSASSGYGHQSSSGYPQPRYLQYNNNNNSQRSSQKISHEVKMSRIPEKFHDEKDGSEIYVMDSAFPKRSDVQPGSTYSQYSAKSRAPSEMSSVKTKTSRKNGVVVDTMSAPNPFCPNTKGVCCLLVLVNLGLILVTLGFSIVLQLFDPPFVWYCGIAFLIVGFIALIVSLLFCVHLCRESRETRKQNGLQPGELYWTHHWQKRIALPGIGRTTERGKADDLSTVYSARMDDNSGKKQFHDQNDQRLPITRERDSMTPIHSYQH